MGANKSVPSRFAREADDPEIIKATLANPGVILKRPVGTNEPLGEKAHLPTNLDIKGHVSSAKPLKKPKKSAARQVDDKTARKAALAYNKKEKQRERVRRKGRSGTRQAP